MQQNKKTSILNLKIPVYFIPIFFAGGICLSILFYLNMDTNAKPQENPSLKGIVVSNKYQTSRLSGYDYIKPLLFVEEINESPDLILLKNSIRDFIEENKIKGLIEKASVYLRVFGKGWISLNGSENYHIASLVKVPIMITFLRMSELDPTLLNRKFTNLYDEKKILESNKAYAISNDDKKYTFRDLLYNMMVNNDQTAYYVLKENIDKDLYKKLYADLNSISDLEENNDILVNAVDYSKFLKILYNATYLTKDNSEYALKLLNNPEEGSGFKNGLPANTSVSQKQSIWKNNELVEMSESGIIYLESAPCLLTVMTSGKNQKNLSKVISNITRMTCDRIIHP